MRKIFSLILFVAVAALICSSTPVLAVSSQRTPVEANINAVAGAVGGGWYSTFAAFSEFITENEPGIAFKVLPGTGIGNSATIGNGTFDMGWIYPPMALLAYKGKAPYTDAVEGIRTVATGLSPQVLEVAALKDSDIHSIEDVMKEKKAVRWLTPNRGSTTPALFFELMLDYYNVTEKDVKSWGGSLTFTPYSDWAQLTQDGHIDVMFNQIAIPSSVLQEITTYKEVELLSLPEDLRKYLVDNYALAETIIPAKTYEFLDKDIQTLQMSSGLGAHKDVSEEVVYRILEIIDENIDAMKSIHPSWKNFDITKAWQNAGVPLHPGAEKFYKDKGYMN